MGELTLLALSAVTVLLGGGALTLWSTVRRRGKHRA